MHAYMSRHMLDRKLRPQRHVLTKQRWSEQAHTQSNAGPSRRTLKSAQALSKTQKQKAFKQCWIRESAHAYAGIKLLQKACRH